MQRAAAWLWSAPFAAARPARSIRCGPAEKVRRFGTRIAPIERPGPPTGALGRLSRRAVQPGRPCRAPWLEVAKGRAGEDPYRRTDEGTEIQRALRQPRPLAADGPERAEPEAPPDTQGPRDEFWLGAIRSATA